MAQDTTNKIFTELAQSAAFTGIIEQVRPCALAIFASPKAQVNVGATAGLVKERFRRE